MKFRTQGFAIAFFLVAGVVHWTVSGAAWWYLHASGAFMSPLVENIPGPLLDSVANLILCMPIAYLICLAKPRRLYLYAVLVVVPNLAYSVYGALDSPNPSQILFSWTLWWGWIIISCFVPLAVFILNRTVRRPTWRSS